MNKIFFFISFNLFGFQDSTLFWYNMNSVLEPNPKTKIIIDDIFKTTQLNFLDSINIKNQKIKTGFRLQLFETISKDKADEERSKFQKVLNDTIYIIFEAPLYRLQLGDFLYRKEAEKYKARLIKNGYKNIWIVKSRIRNPSLF